VVTVSSRLSGFDLKEKEKKKRLELQNHQRPPKSSSPTITTIPRAVGFHDVQTQGNWLNVCRHRHVMEMLICVSLRAMENIQPASTLSLYTDLFYLLRVSHSSGVHRRVNLIYCEVPHSGMKCFIHRQD